MIRALCPLLLSTTCALAGCWWGNKGTYDDNATGTGTGRFHDDHVAYAVAEPGDGWTKVTLESTNIAWHHPGLGAGILVNSHCEGVKDAPLEGLTGELMMGTTEREIVEQTLKPFSGREALETIATGKIDGVPRKRGMFVLKKDGCVYDVVYDSRPDRFDDGLAAFRRVCSGLEVGPRRDRG